MSTILFLFSSNAYITRQAEAQERTTVRLVRSKLDAYFHPFRSEGLYIFKYLLDVFTQTRDAKIRITFLLYLYLHVTIHKKCLDGYYKYNWNVKGFVYYAKCMPNANNNDNDILRTGNDVTNKGFRIVDMSMFYFDDICIERRWFKW